MSDTQERTKTAGREVRGLASCGEIRAASERSGGGGVILFDGECGFCSRAVMRIIRLDRRAVFRFAARRSGAAAALMGGREAVDRLPESMILVRGERVLVRSDAVLGIAAGLGLPWSMARVFLLVPRVLRDGAYAWVARNRHRWSGGAPVCAAPTPEQRARFLAEPEGGAGS